MPETPPQEDRSAVSWLPLALGSVGLLVVAVAGFLLFAFHRTQRAQAERIEALEHALVRIQADQARRGALRTAPTRRAPLPSAEDAAALADPHPRVVLVNEKDGVYAVSLGSAHGARFGDRVRILRNGTVITELILDSVQPTASAGKRPPNAPQVPLHKGDTVELIQDEN